MEWIIRNWHSREIMARLEGNNLAQALRQYLRSEAETSPFGANLSWADFTDADFADENLSGANLSGAHLTGAHLAGTDLTDADLTGADFLEGHDN